MMMMVFMMMITMMMMVLMMMMMIVMMMMTMMMMVIHLDLLKDDGEPPGHALVPSQSRSNYHTLHTGEPHLVFGKLVFLVYLVYLVFGI